jgi:hypothetical protein
MAAMVEAVMVWMLVMGGWLWKDLARLEPVGRLDTGGMPCAAASALTAAMSMLALDVACVAAAAQAAREGVAEESQEGWGLELAGLTVRGC